MRTCERFLLAILTIGFLTGCGKPLVDDSVIPATEGQLPPWASTGAGSVTNVYGLGTIREGSFQAESKIKPWSSWWFPARDPYLFQSGPDGGMSPLQRYDRWVTSAHSSPGKSALYEKEKLYDPNAASWEGLCNAWAIASIMEKEPTKAVELKGVKFRVGDVKGLLVKTYERTEGLRFFGQRYNGDRTSDYADIYPDQFHRILQTELFEKGHPVIMDKDPGIAVWNTPIWKAEVRVIRDPVDTHTAHVTTWLTGASPFVESPDFVGTLPVSFELTYDLYGEPTADGAIEVHSGTWTGGSIDFHPDFVTVVPDKKVHRSLNPEIRPEWVDELVKASTS